MTKWITKPLGEFVSLQRGHDLTESERRPGTVPVMGSAGENGTHDTPRAPGPGVVIGRSGASFGQVHFVDRDYWPHNTCLYVTDFRGNDPRFAYYLIKRIRFDGHNSGSAQPSLNRNFIYSIPVTAPEERADQIEIARLLSDFDDKVALNRSMSQTLKAMAQAIFKSWFVDSSTNVAEPVTLKKLTAKIGSGATPRGGSDVYVDEGAALIRSQNVYDSEFVWDGLARITDEAATQLANVQVQPGDVLLNITGASILRTCVVPPDVLPARVNQHVAIVRAKPGVSPHYLHLHLLKPETKAYLLGLNAGGSREAVTKAHIESVPLMDPGAERMNAFHQAVAPLFALAQSLDAENRKLASLRDELLPKLLSGELKPGIHEEADAAMIAEAVGA